MMRSALLAIIFAISAGAAVAAVTLELAEDFPERGTPVTVRLNGGEMGETYSFSVTYRPNSETARVEEVGDFSADGALTWTPVDAGITSLSVIDSAGAVLLSKNIAVRFASPPVSGLLIFILAGLLLFGGSTVFMRRALES